MAEQGPAGGPETGELRCIAARAIFSVIHGVEHVKLTCDLPKGHEYWHHDPLHGLWTSEVP